jgi:general secretion pathway protein A
MTPWWPFFGAHQPPFTRDIPIERLWLTPALREWQARFAAVLAEHGLAVLTGESGVGKSTALRLVWQTLTPTHYLPLYLPVSDAWTPRQLYRALARLLDLPPTPFADDTERQVRDTLWTLATQQGRLPVLALDEAHLLTPRLLQELRFLLNFALDTTAPLAVVLAGHTELRQKLAWRPLEAIRQRVTLAYQLPPFTAEQTARYVQHHLQSVGIDHPVFTDSALQAGHDWSQGIARRLNTWARTCLLAAYATQSPLVDDTVVATAIHELQWAGTVSS